MPSMTAYAYNPNPGQVKMKSLGMAGQAAYLDGSVPGPVRHPVSKIRCRETEEDNQDRVKEGWTDCTLQIVDSSMHMVMTMTKKAENYGLSKGSDSLKL